MTITSIVGSDKILDEIEQLLKREESSIIRLKGPDGRGKSWIASNLIEKILNSDYCCINLSGDGSRTGEAFYPLKQFVEKKDKIRNKALGVAKELTGRIPYVGKEVQLLVKDYDFKGHKKTIQDLSPFKSHLDFALHLLALHRKYKKVLIVCDDFEAFDDSTVTFISELKSGFMHLKEEFNISLLLISNSEAQLHDFIVGNVAHEIELPALQSEQIYSLVHFWSGRKISPEQLQLVNSCTGGHLSLVKLVAEHFKETSKINLVQNDGAALRSVVDSRLRKQKDQYDPLKNLLHALVKSGKPSTTYEMLCLLEEQEGVRDLIQQAVQMNLLVVKNNYIHFSHPIIKDYIDSFQNKPKASFYDKLSACIKKLTPSNYARRALVERLAHNDDKADVFWGLACVQKLREGAFVEAGVIQNEITNSEYGSGIVEALDQFKICYEYSFKGEIDDTLLEIEQISNSLPKELLAEKNFLKCENLAKKISNAPKEEALDIISHWEEIREEEPEVWYRLMQLRIITASELGLIDFAKKTEAEIVKYFSSRLAFDVHARSILEKLNLFSEVIYTPEIAHKKMLQTEKWLSKEVSNEQYHRVIDLFIARTNLSSNSILVNDMGKAIQFALEAIELAKEYNAVRFPGVETPLSNYYLAQMFRDMNNLPSIIKGYKEIYDATYVEENKILFDINYAGFLLLDNQVKQAKKVLDAGSYIPHKEDDDNYYCYYYWSNYALVTFLSGNAEDAKSHFSGLDERAQNVSFFLRKYYVKHFQIMKEMLEQTNIRSYNEVRRFFEDRQPIFESKAWDRFKFGYLLTDVQLWTSS